MKSRNSISNFVIGFICLYLMVPFIATIFFIRTGFLFPTLLTSVAATGFIMSSFAVYCFVEARKYFRLGVLAGIFGVIILFFVTYGFQLSAADYVYFKIRENRFNEFVAEIKKYEKIKSLQDRKNYGGSLNDKRYTYKEKDINMEGENPQYAYKDLLRKLNIDEKTHEDFCNRLLDLGCIEFQTFEDGAVCFTINGMLNHCEVITYTQTGEPHVIYGAARSWKKIQDNWYAWNN